MRDRSFADLETNAINLRCRRGADKVYQMWWPGCSVVRMDDHNHPFAREVDRSLGIDGYVAIPGPDPGGGGRVSFQEKFREYRWLECGDFTQEILNAAGTPQESIGEWGKLLAQYYLYAWEAEGADGSLARAVLIDVACYREVVRRNGGLLRMGRRFDNDQHGRAAFVAIPIESLREAFVVEWFPESWS